MSEFTRGRLQVVVEADRAAMGRAAADYAAERLRTLLAEQARVRVVFAAAASQAEMLDALAVLPGIDWGRVDAFHLDEYIGLPAGHPEHFGAWLERHIWSRVRPGTITRLDGANPDGPEAEADRYGGLLAADGIDLGLVGVGENGHVAFNDPHVADFDDPLWVKPVEIDDTSRHQQVRDGAFARFDEVPSVALTITMTAIRACRVLSIVVPGPQKAAAVAAMLDGPITTACPASILREHPDARLFLDEAAAGGVAH